MFIIEQLGNQVGYEALTPTTATTFTAALISPTSGAYNDQKARSVQIYAEDYGITYRMDGTAPTEGVGMKLDVGEIRTIIGHHNIKNFKCIDTADGASTVRCLFFF